MVSRITTLTLLLLVLLGSCYVSFLVGRETAKPSLTKALVGNFAAGPIVDLVTGALYDAKIVVDRARLDVCLDDSRKLEEANRDLSSRLGTFESRLRSAQQSNLEIRESLQKSYDTTKKLSERLYNTTCYEWANTEVCPALRGRLRSAQKP